MISRILAGTIVTMAFLVDPVAAQSPPDLIDRQSQRWGNADRQMQLQDSQWRQQLQRQQLDQMRWLSELRDQQRQRELRDQQRQREEWLLPSCQPRRR